MLNIDYKINLMNKKNCGKKTIRSLKSSSRKILVKLLINFLISTRVI